MLQLWYEGHLAIKFLPNICSNASTLTYCLIYPKKVVIPNGYYIIEYSRSKLKPCFDNKGYVNVITGEITLQMLYSIILSQTSGIK